MSSKTLLQILGEVLVGIALLLLWISVWVQQGFWQALIFLVAIFLCAFIWVGPKLGIPGFYSSGIFLLFVAFALAWAWLTYVGTSHRGVDIATIVIAWFLVMIIGSWVMSRSRGYSRAEIVPSAKETFTVTLAAIAAIWISLSAVNGWLERSPVFVRKAEVRSYPSNQSPHKAKLAIALSGGGYRAALFHAGVLDILQKHGISFQAMSTVSGGSIFGAFYATGGEPTQFLDAVIQGRFNLKRELLRFDNVLRLLGSAVIPFGNGARVWPFEGAPRTSDIHAAMLDRLLFRGLTLSDGIPQDRPELMICTTDLLGGSALGIMPHGVILQRILELQRRYSFGNASASPHDGVVEFLTAATNKLPMQPISRLVAASGAFPAALSAIEFGGDANVKDKATLAPTYVLADGGLIDNFGIRLAYSAIGYAKEQSRSGGGELKKWDVDVLLVSDGSAYVANERPRGTVDELRHGIELMYQNASGPEQLVLWQQGNALGLRMLWISPRLTIGRSESSSDPGASNTKLGRAQHEVTAGPSIPLKAISVQAIDFLAEHMTPADKVETLKIRDQLRLRGVLSENGWQTDTSDSDPLFAMLVDQLNREMGRRFKAFASTSTLVDNIESDIATSIYKLGQYVGLLNLSSLATR